MQLLLATCIVLFAFANPIVVADNVSDYITPCQDESTDFTVKVQFDTGKSNGWEDVMCTRSYSRCPFSDGSCLSDDDSEWAAESGKTFDYLETKVFHIPNGSSPTKLFVKDDTGYDCARAFYQDQYHDFKSGTNVDVISSWYDGSNPVQITIIPFSSGGGSCQSSSDDEFDAARALAIWLSPYAGQVSDPNDGSTYCDVSINPEECLNIPFWDIDGNELVLYGSLANVLQTNPSSVNIYIPEGYDITLPISNMEVRFRISGGDCAQFLKDGVTSCQVDKSWLAYTPTDVQITVSGLGRINGWETMQQQRDDNIRMSDGEQGDIDTLLTSEDFSDWQSIGYWYMFSLFLSLASSSSDMWSIDVSGVETAWGSRQGKSSIQLNNHFFTNYNTPVKLFDFKQAGFWNKQSDGVDIMGTASYSSYNYLHTNDDALKIASTEFTCEYQTLLKGNAGCAVNLDAFGYEPNDINNSHIDGIYVHRIVHNSQGFQGCSSSTQDDGWSDENGGVVCTRSCGQNKGGLSDATISNLYIPEIGDVNSVATSFGIGVNTKGSFCNGGTPVDHYPIKNLIFENWNIYPNPSCKSSIYDDAGIVEWGSGATPSITFFSPKDSDPSNCDFQGAVSFSSGPQYFVCGLDDSDAAAYCMTTDGIGGSPNIDYFVDNGVNVNIDFPTCGYSTEDLDLLATA